MSTVPEILALGWDYHRAGDLPRAAQAYHQVLLDEPDNTDALFLLGLVSQARGALAEAVPCFRRVLRQRPDLAEAHNNLGVALADLGELGEAVECYRQAVRLKPDYGEAHNNLGVALARLGRNDEAEAVLRVAARLQPAALGAQNNLGLTLCEQGKLDEAVACFRHAARLKPDDAETLNHLGSALADQGQTDAALQCFERAIRLRPDDVSAYRNRALAWLLKGDFERGWVAFEGRWMSRVLSPPSYRQPPWDGRPLDGRTILLYAEQGLGDTLQFIRYGPLVGRCAGQVIVACPPRLIPILSSCPGIDRLVSQDDPPPSFDVHAPLMSLPRLLGTTLDTVPADVPYLHADPALTDSWRGKTGPARSFKVGIAWQGNPKHPRDRHRSIPLVQFAPLARLDGVRLVSLQKGPGVDQLKGLKGAFEVDDLGDRLDEATGSFMETAAVMRDLDLVVTVDSALAHLAGALGVKVWVALSFSPDWRWMLGREDSPWYPTMRLFRQTTWGDWTGVFDRIARALEAEASRATPRPAPPITINISAGELIDRITILEIKSERVHEETKLRNIRSELGSLAAAHDRAIGRPDGLDRLTADLKAVNEALWEAEDGLRACERDGDFGPRFTSLARSVYLTNDRRAALKSAINERLGSVPLEEKSYTSYARVAPG